MTLQRKLCHLKLCSRSGTLRLAMEVEPSVQRRPSTDCTINSQRAVLTGHSQNESDYKRTSEIPFRVGEPIELQIGFYTDNNTSLQRKSFEHVF